MIDINKNIELLSIINAKLKEFNDGGGISMATQKQFEQISIKIKELQLEINKEQTK